MPGMPERLRALTVRDLMQPEVTAVSVHDTLAVAAATLTAAGRSAAPVVDSHGHCVGLLTASDFLRRAAEVGSGDDPGFLLSRAGAGSSDNWHPAPLTTELVDRWMSPAVQGVSPETLLIDLAHMLCAAHLHRLPVLDERGRVLGIVSTLDLVAALAKALDEDAACGAGRASTRSPTR